MATTDVFNNPANNYVNPNLSVCEGTGSGTNLEFLSDKSIAIVQGTNILESISFADIKIPVGSFTSNRKVLEPGEITFIQGLAKGLDYRSQAFTLPNFVSNDKNPYFMVVDLSVGFYKNFKYYLFDLEASANYANNISIDVAINLALSNIQAKITSVYDPSDLTFTGTQQGWDFNISNVELTLIDTSENALSPFGNLGSPQIFDLEEDLSKMVLYAKYPHSAMQGIIMKITYPPVSSSMSIYDEWIYINHVPDVVTIFEPIQINNFIKDLGLVITFDPLIKFGPFITNFSGATYGLDLVGPGSGSYPLGAVDSSFSGYDLTDSSLYASNLILASTFLNGILENSWVNKDYPLLPYGNPLNKVEIALSKINDCSIANARIDDSSVFKSTFIGDVSLYGCTLYNCTYDPSLVYLDPNCIVIRINESIDSSIDYDSSIYYTPVIKSIEVGMSGCSNLSLMSSGDYLQWITDNEDWQKVGEIYIWLATPDFSDTKNLIDGFYAFNPHDFPVQLEYMTVV